MIARFAGLTFDSGQRQVIQDSGAALHLTPKAFDLLALLIAEAPRVVPKSEIHERLWPGIFVTDATLVGLVKELRRTLQDHDARAPIIRTSHGIGYAFSGGLEKPNARQSSTEHWIVDGARNIPLREGENLIGRDSASAVWLDLAGVSRRHARIVIRGRVAELEDSREQERHAASRQADDLADASARRRQHPNRPGPRHLSLVRVRPVDRHDLSPLHSPDPAGRSQI